MCMTLAEYEAAVAHDDRVAKERKYFEWITQRREPIARAKLAAIRELRELKHLEEVVLAPVARRRPASARVGGSPDTSTSPRPLATNFQIPQKVEIASPVPSPRSDASSSSSPRQPVPVQAPPTDAVKQWRPLSAGGKRVICIPAQKPCIPLWDEVVIESSRVEWKDWRPSRLPRPVSAISRTGPGNCTRHGSNCDGPYPVPSPLRPKPDPTLAFNSGARVRAAVIGRPQGSRGATASARHPRPSLSPAQSAAAIRQNSTCGIVGKILAVDGKLTRSGDAAEAEPRAEGLGAGGSPVLASRFGNLRTPCGVRMDGSTSVNRLAASRERALAQRLKAAERLWSLKKEVTTIGRV